MRRKQMGFSRDLGPDSGAPALKKVRFGVFTAGLAITGLALAGPRWRKLAKRWVTVGLLGARTAGRAAAHQTRRFGADDESRRRLDAEFEMKSAEDVASTLGNMKGAFMKAGQLLSFVDDGMPEHVRAALAQLQDSAPPISAELAASVIRAELREGPDQVFLEWEPKPIAAASIGQVHRARLRDADGTEVAVKLQYPGVDETMAADLAQLDLGRLVAPALWRHVDMAAVTAELRTRLTEEVDYRIELQNQRDFATWYAGHPFIKVPAVFEEYSTQRVLTSALVDGRRFSDMESWPQHERDKAAEAIFRFVHRSLNDHRAFNGDPHPGNYLFHGDGVVTFLDFGLVKRLESEDVADILDVADAAAINANARRLRLVLERIGYFVPGSPLPDELIAKFSSLFWDYLAEDRPVTLTAEWASEVVRQYLFKGEEFGEINKWGAMPTQSVILQRITVGLFAILGRLNATANWRRILMELWFEGPPSTPMGEQEVEWLERRAALST